MLCKRLIAVILVADGWVVQSVQFKHTNVVGDAYTAVDFYNEWSIDEIVLLDVSRKPGSKFLHILDKLSERCFIPLTTGGWIRTLNDIRDRLNRGADKVVINTQAFREPDFIKQASDKFGSQCIVVSIDVFNNEVWVDRGRSRTLLTPVDWAKFVAKLGAGEILLRSIKHDGMGRGYDLELITEVSKAVSIPVVACGGVGDWKHLAEGLDAGADAVAVANKFHFSDFSTKRAREYLLSRGYNIRRTNFDNDSTPRNNIYDERGTVKTH